MNKYNITVTALSEQETVSEAYDTNKTLNFDAFCHDDLFLVIEYLKEKKLMDDDALFAFAVGMKLFGEALKNNRGIPLFKHFLPELSRFIKELKSISDNQ